MVAAPQLEGVAEDQDPAVRLSAQVTRLSFEANLGKRFEVAEQAIRAPEVEIRVAGLKFLAEAHLPPDSAAVLLIQALDDTASSVREEALLQLGRMGSDATMAIPAIEALLEEADPETRRLIQRTLQRIRG
jgi:HEAT repeat protein